MIVLKNISNPLLRNLRLELEESDLPFEFIESYNNTTGDCSISFTTTLTAQEETDLDTLISNHSNVTRLTDQVKASYDIHRVNGQNYFDDTRAWLVSEVLLGSRTEADVYGIEAQVNLPLQMINRGDWKSANIEMSSITPVAPLDQATYDKVRQEIIDYINDNY